MYNYGLQKNKSDINFNSDGNSLRVHAIRSLLGFRLVLLSVASGITIVLYCAIDYLPGCCEHSFGVYANCTFVFSFDN